MSENLEKRIRSRSIQKHDLEVNWNKATGFVPYKGELIVYDREVDEDGNTLKDTEGKLLLPEGRTTPYTYERIKIGDGINVVTSSNLPFIDAAVKAEIDAIKNGETFIPVLQMGQEKSGLNFISESGKWEPNPSGNYWSGWSAVNDVLELEDGSTVTVNTWQLKGMWLYGNNYLHILITPQGIFERDLYVDSSYKRQQSKWRKYSTTTDVKTKTSVTVGGVHQETFDADSKVSIKPSWSTNQNTPWESVVHAQFNNQSQFEMPVAGNLNSAAFVNLGKNASLLQKFFGGSPLTTANVVPVYFPKPFLSANDNQVRTTIDTNAQLWGKASNSTGIGELLTGYPTTLGSAINKLYADNTFLKKSGGTINGNLNITGKLQVQGTTETVNAVTYKIKNNVIEFNPDKIHNETWLTGLAINKGSDGETDLGTYGIMYDPSTDAVKLGFGQVDEENKFKFNENESAPIATREEFDDSWEDDAIFVFDKTTKKFKYSGKTLSGFKKEIQDEMKSYIADYIETYMSTEIEVNDDSTSLYTNGKTKEVMTEDGNLWLYVGGTNE